MDLSSSSNHSNDNRIKNDHNAQLSQLTTSLAAAAAEQGKKKEDAEAEHKKTRRDAEQEEEEEEGEDDSDDDDDEEDEEETEPQLKYQRLRGSLEQIFNSENGNYASALAVGDKFLALGTHLGYLYILDFEGNSNPEQQYRAHTESINDLSIDESGEFVASCSNDGRVAIHGLYGTDRIEFKYNRPMTSVAIDPDFKKKTDKPVCSGGKEGKLVLTRKGWLFGSNKEQVIHKGEGPIYAVRWHKQYIAWGNDHGVKIYDVSQQQKIGFIKRPANAPRAEMFRCCLVWVDGKVNRTFNKQRVGKYEQYHTLIIAWGQTINVVVLKERLIAANMTVTGQQNIGGAPFLRSFSSLEATGFAVDFYICGVAPYESNLIVLAYDEDEGEHDDDDDGEEEGNDDGKKSQLMRSRESPRPELRIYDLEGEELALDALSIRDYEHYFATDYRLEFSREDLVFYILSQRDIVLAKPRDADDHVKWLVGHEKYWDAFTFAKENGSELRTQNVEAIGHRFLTDLMQNMEYKKVAENLSVVCGDNGTLWEHWIYEFINKKQFHIVLPHIPLDSPRLEDTKIYEMKLNYYLMYDHDKFLACIKKWPRDLYTVNTIITAILEQLKRINPKDESKRETQMVLLDALAELYLYQKQYDMALKIYFRLGRPEVFEFIQEYDLFSSVQDTVGLLMDVDKEQALRLLIRNTDKIPVDNVVTQLRNRKKLHRYLHELFKKNDRQAQKYHLLQVELYAEYDLDGLVSFLQHSQSYNIEKALQTVEEAIARHPKNDNVGKKKLFQGKVYLLGRMGNTSDALELIIDRLQDVDFAIEFVEEQRDSELWQQLINHSLKSSAFIAGLLDHISDHIADHIDPISLVKKIPEGMEIPCLKYKLLNIINDYSLQLTLQQGCQEILKNDTKELSRKLFNTHRQGMRISANKRCVVCAQALRGSISRDDCVIFFCGHSYHASCHQDVFRGHMPNEEAKETEIFCIVCERHSSSTSSSNRTLSTVSSSATRSSSMRRKTRD